MANSKLLKIIQSFSTEEREEFTLFLKSPFFVRGGPEEMLRFFNCLVVAENGDQDAFSNKANLHEMVYPEKPFSEARLERATTRLYQYTEQFLKTQYYQRPTNSHQQLLDLARVYEARNLVSLYEKQLLNLKKTAHENTLESSKNYLFKYQIAREEHHLKSLANNGKNDLAISDLLENLGLFYYTEQAEMLNRFLLQQQTGIPKTTQIIELALEAAPAPDYFEKKSPLLSIRKKIRDFFFRGEPDRAKFENLTVLLKAYEHGLTNDVISDIYAFLRSYGSYLITLGHYDLQETIHEIQKDNLKKGFFYINDKINPPTLINITKMALGINKVQWAKEFVESHRYRIANESELEEVYKLNLALCLFEEKKYEEALLHVLYSFYSNAFFSVARRLELSIYFELDSDLLPYKIDAFRKYVERTGSKKSSDLDWEANNNFVNILLQISQSAPNDAKRSALIIQRIEKKKIVGERRWLLEKAHKLA